MERKAKTVQNAIDERIKAIAEAVQKKFKSPDALTILSDSSEFATVKKFISFGHWGLNRAVSGMGKHGGIPCGRLTEVYGKWSTGKSLLIACALAQCQQAGGIAGLDDLEHAYLKEFGKIVGVNNDLLLYAASDTIEECLDKAEFTLLEILKTTMFGMFAIDSVALVKSQKEDEETIEGKTGFGTEKAKALHSGSRKLVSIIGKSDIALVIANQTRQAVGVMFGDSETTAGGDAIPFWSSVRIRLAIKELIREIPDDKNSEIIGVRGEAFIKKNKIAKPFRKTAFDIIFDKGLLYASGCADILVREHKITEASKGWYEFNRSIGSGVIVTGKKYRKSEVEEIFESEPDWLEELYED